MEVEEDVEFTPRSYQDDLLNIAINDNTILYLPTGSGKTYIAVMLIKEKAAEVTSSYETGAKRTIFLVNTVNLVEQQANYLEKFTNLTIGRYSGETRCDFWDKTEWESEISKNQVLVMTAQILVNIVQHGYFDLERCNLLIFDECHHAVDDHPMRLVMQNFENIDKENAPRVLGLTATLLNRNVKPMSVLQEVKLLERTYQSRVATVQSLDVVYGHSTNPKELLIKYSDYNRSEIAALVIRMIENLKKNITSIKFVQRVEHPKKDSCVLIEGANPVTKINNALQDVIEHIDKCGLYGCSKAILSHIVQFERLRKHAQNEEMHRTMQIIITGLTATLKIIEDHMASEKDVLRKILKFSSDQVLKLIDLLIDFQAKVMEGSVKPLCCIVFVQKRFSAKILYHILKNLKKSHSKFDFINPEFIVGFNNNPYNDTRELVFERKQNLQVLDHFKQKQVNVLFSTNVIEEGIDVPECTLVIMFDAPQNYRSYIQSKGRARHKDSQYVLMFSQEISTKFLPKLNQYREVEIILQDMLIQTERLGPTQKEIEQELYDHDIQPFVVESTGAKATMTSAVALINRYCLSLPQDMFTQLTPLWYKSLINANNLSSQTYKVVLEMPIVSKLRDEIHSPYMKNLKDAKRSAALFAIRKLHEIGELNDNLLPNSKEKVLESVNYLFSHWSDNDNILKCSTKIKAGSKNMKRRYLKRCPSVLSKCCPQSTGDIVYLHIIEFTPKYSKPSEINACHTMFYELINSKNTYGIITTKPLPEICDFPLYLSSGEIQIHILRNQKIKLKSMDDLIALKQFHAFIFGLVLKLVKPFLIFDNLNGDNSYIVVPVNYVNNEYGIDYHAANTYKTVEEIHEPTLHEKRNISVTDSNYLCNVVYPWYRNRDTGYIVCEVTHSMNALSNFPSDNFDTFCEYYQCKWNLTIENPTQPLLLVKAMSNRLNCLKPRGESKNSFKKKTLDNEDFEEYFLPELCIKMSLPPLFWLKGKCIPSILHRIHFLLLADELRRKISTEANIGILEPIKTWMPLKIDSCLLNSKGKENQKDEIDNFVGGRQSPDGETLDMKKLEFQLELTDRVQYPWKEDQEPVDLERNIETVTVFEIEYFDTFVSRKLTGDMSSYEYYKTNMSPETQQKLAITFEEPVKDSHINLLYRKRSDTGPELWQVYQAITAVTANDVLNLERYETLGDSFLKLGSSLYLYLKFHDWNEGNLTSVKGQIVGNKNLFYCGQLKELGSIMKVNDFEPNADWFPPKFCIPHIPQNILEKSDLSASVFYNFDIPIYEQLSGNLSDETQNNINQVLLNSINEKLKLSTSMEDYICHQIVNDKTIADGVEALIGCYLCSNGVDGAFSMLEWFRILPKNENISQLMYHNLPSPLIKPATPQQIQFFIPNWHLLENKINYKFTNKAYLLQALTHSSYTSNKITNCYQRLEFIGDAILDFLITSYIFEQCGEHMTPGDITDLRSALVNNVVFASLSVRNGFHKHIKYFNPRLNDVILNFVRHQEERNFVINDEVLILLEEGDYHLAEYIDVPKVLGDVFEAIIGAIFLDSGMNLEVTWNTIYTLMKKEITEFSRNIPKNPVRLLYETVHANPKYLEEKITSNGSIMSKLSFYIDGKKKIVYGFGDNKKQAKRAAAKIALRAINASRKIDDIY